jgi:hypothetical protein
MTVDMKARNSPVLPDAAKTRLVALGLFTLVLAFYLYTLQPSLSWGDGTRLQREAISSESFILAELVDVEFAPDPFPFARLGVAAWDHPLYVIVGHLLVRALPGVDALWLVNLLSAVFGAATIAVLFWLCYANTYSLLASLFAALSLTVSHTFWFHAATPEVYTLFTFLLLLSLQLYDRYERTGRRFALVASFFVLGLGASNHVLTFFAGPAAVLYYLLSGGFKRETGLKLRWLWLPGLAFLAGFSPYLIQFARMLRTFPVSQVMGPVVGSTFLRGLMGTTPLLLLASTLTFLGYLLFQFSPLGVAFGIYGLWKGSPEFAPLWRKTVAFFAVYWLFGIAYRVSDQFAFFLGAYVFWAVAIAMGVARFASSLTVPKRKWLAGGLGLAIVVMPLFYGAVPALVRSVGVTDESFGIPQIGVGVRDGLAFYLNPNKRGDDAAYRFGRETMENLPPDAVVIAQWYTDTDEYFVLRYFATIEGLRPDVELVGWPREEPIDFDSNIALDKVESLLEDGRPVFLASLSEDYYRASTLIERYCVVPEGNLYRVYLEPPPTSGSAQVSCQKNVPSSASSG